jgi:DNA (cytosine-5)-methyltransferase 1
LKILNLYSGIGGNRKLWGNDYEITAVEFNSDIAKIYKDFFPNDNVIIDDAHKFLLKHYKEYDFIWTSPPCQTHSSFRQNICVRFRNTKPEYPDMKLYQEIIFLKNNFTGKFVVENVKPYYQPLIIPDIILQRHLFWCNFKIENKNFETDLIRESQISDLQKKTGFNLDAYKINNKRQVLRNCVKPEIGKYILDRAINKEIFNQGELFKDVL